MQQENEFAQVMANLEVKELIEIINDIESAYLPEAKLAAQEELDRRNISEEKRLKTEKEIQDKRDLEYKKANAPLQDSWRVIIFFMPGITTLIIAGTLKADGYHRRFKEALRWSLYGLSFYVSLAILLIILIG